MSTPPDFIPLGGEAPVGKGGPPQFIPLDGSDPAKRMKAPQERPQGFVNQTVHTVEEAAKAALKSPGQAAIGLGKGIVGGIRDLGELAAQGTMALVQSMFTYNPVDPKLTPQQQASGAIERDANTFVTNLEAAQKLTKHVNEVSSAISHVNLAPVGHEQKAAAKLLGILPEGINAAGDTVYEKTGNALAGAGTKALLTLLSFKPGIATDMIKPILSKTKSKAAAGIDELAATEPEAATTLAEHVGQVDPNLEKYIKTKIKKFTDASDQELGKIGKDAAAAAIKELEGDAGVIKETIKGRQTGQAKPVPTTTPPKGFEQVGVTPGGKPRLRPITVDQAGASIRTTILEAQKALTDMTKPKETRAAERERIATLRAKAEGVEPEFHPEPIPRRAAEHEGEVIRRRAKDTPEADEVQNVKKFPKQTVPGSVKDLANELEKGTGTSRIKDQLNDPAKLQSYMKDNVGVAEAWSLDYIRENWKANLTHSPGYTYPFSVESIGVVKHFKTELEARKYAKKENALSAKEIQRLTEERKQQGIPDHESVTEFNYKKDFPEKPTPPDDKGPKGPGVVYLNAGIPVTREAVAGAFNALHELVRYAPGVKIGEAKLANLYDKFLRTFNPEALGPEAKTAGLRIAQNFFEQARRELAVWENSRKRRDYWNAMGEEAGMKFIMAAEKGQKFVNSLWEETRQAYKTWADNILKQDLKTGFDYTPLENYLPHLFEDREAAIEALDRLYGTKWNDPRFIHQRGFKLYEDAFKEGLKLEAQGKKNPFKPKYKNPEDLMMARQRASDIAQLRTELLAQLEKDGVAIEAKPGETLPPEGYSGNSRRSPTGKRYWVHKVADAVMKNAFDNKSLWENPNLAGDIFKGYMGLKNSVVTLKLMGSAFHPMHLLGIDAAAAMTRETKLLYAGPTNPLVRASRFMTQFAVNLPYTPVSAIKSAVGPFTKGGGYSLLRVFQGKRDLRTLSEADKKAFQILTESGMVPTRPREEISGQIQKYHDALTKHSVKALWHAPWAALASLGHPVYSLWIPSLKIGSLLKDAAVAMKINPELATNALRRGEMLRHLAKRVEYRYGEMNYQSLFMNKVVKDIGVASNLSLGWNLGLTDQYAGGAIDLANLVRKPGSITSKVKAGEMDRVIHSTYYVTGALMVGALIHRMFTGKNPETIQDYTHPMSGEVDEHGRPIRLNTMFYTREFEGLYKRWQSEGAYEAGKDFLANKGSGVMEMARTALEGVDSLGREVRDPDAPAYKKLEQTLLYEFGELDPIAVEAFNKSTTGGKAKQVALTFAGFTPAGKYISQSVTENKIDSAYNKYVRSKETPYDKLAYSKDVKELQKAYNANSGDYDKLLDKVQDKFDLKTDDIRRLEKQFRKGDEFDPLAYQFKRLPWEQQKRLLDQMDDKEREKYIPLSNKKHLRDNYDPPPKAKAKDKPTDPSDIPA